MIPADTYVVPAIALVHLRPELYPDPHEFRPERFLEGGAGGTYTWIPFGGGVRRCVGAAFAFEEMKVVTRTVLERARLRADRPRPEGQRARHVTVVPSRGGRVVVEERLSRVAPN
jgi:cytochrome P450